MMRATFLSAVLFLIGPANGVAGPINFSAVSNQFETWPQNIYTVEQTGTLEITLDVEARTIRFVDTPADHRGGVVPAFSVTFDYANCRSWACDLRTYGDSPWLSRDTWGAEVGVFGSHMDTDPQGIRWFSGVFWDEAANYRTLTQSRMLFSTIPEPTSGFGWLILGFLIHDRKRLRATARRHPRGPS